MDSLEQLRVDFYADSSKIKSQLNDLSKQLDGQVVNSADKASAALDKIGPAGEKSAQTVQRQMGRAATTVEKDLGRAASNAGGGFGLLGGRATKAAEGVGKVASKAGALTSALGGATSIAGAFGIYATTQTLLDGAALGIHAIYESLKDVKTEASESAAALRDYTLAQLTASGSADGVTLAQLNLRDATKKLTDARNDGKSSADDITRLEVGQRDAVTDLAVAQATLAKNTEIAKKKHDDFANQLGQVIEKSKRYTAAGRVAGAASLDQAASAQNAAKNLRDLAASSDTMTDAEKATTRHMADLIEKAGQVPEDINTVVDAPGANETLAQLATLIAQANALDGRRIEITTHNDTTIETHRIGNKGGAYYAAQGAFMEGRFAGDTIPVWMGRDEAIVNGQQIDMLGRGRVMSVLAATGAPTIRAGGSHAGGGWPHKQKKEKPDAYRSRVDNYAQNLEQRTEDRWDTRLDDYDNETARQKQRAERGGGVYPASQLAAREQAAIALITKEEKALRALRSDFSKHHVSTGDITKKLHDLHQDKLDRLTDLGDAQYDAAHPGGTDSGPDASALQGRIDSLTEQLAITLGTQSGFNAALGGAGGLGFGGGPVGPRAAAGGVTVHVTTLHPGDPQTLHAIGTSTVRALSQAGAVRASRRRIGVL